MNVTAIESIKNVWTKQGNRIALIEASSGHSFTYHELAAMALATSEILSDQQQTVLKSTDHVVVCLDNRIETLVTLLACLHLGWVTVPINPQLTTVEVNKIINITQPKLIISHESIWDHSKKNIILWSNQGQLDLHKMSLPTAIDSFLINLHEEQLLHLMLTSGTTGLPKGVPVYAKRIFANGLAFIQLHQLKSGSVFYNILPLCYLGGWYNLFLIPILSKGTVVLDQPFGPSNAYNFWATILQYQINTLWFTPTMLSMLLTIGLDNEIKQHQPSSQIQHAFVGMAPLAPSLKSQFEQTFGLNLLENYGLSETFFISTQLNNQVDKPNAVGTILEGIEIKFRDPSNHQPHSSQGEMLVRSPYMISQYYNNMSDLSFSEDGFFITGDIGHRDDQGLLYITGRKKELIIRGGVNISPKEIEAILYNVAAVKDAAVIGVSDPNYGEKVIAFITLKHNHSITKSELKAACAEKLLPIKRPTEYVFMDDMPVNASKKIQKAKLRTLYLEKT